MNRGTLASALIASAVAFSFFQTHAVADTVSNLPGQVPSARISRAIEIGRTVSFTPMQLAVTLKPRDGAGLVDLITRLYDPADPLYHHFLTPQQLTDQFGPTQDDVDQVTQYLASQGFRIVKTHPNRLIIDVEGPVSMVEGAFQLQMHDYISAEGRVAHAPTTEPILPDAVSSKLVGIVGMDSFSHFKTHIKRSPHSEEALTLEPNGGGLSPRSACVTSSTYLTPPTFKSAYNVTTSNTGSGETLALFELDGYTASDISNFANCFSISEPTLQKVLVDGASGNPSATDGPLEVTLDIELAMAMAPGVSKIMVYEGPNTSQGVLDTYSKIQTDGLANEVSTSWGEAENELGSSTLNSEQTIFMNMAAAGQSFFAAAGDSGAYDDSPNGGNSTLEVDDPGSQLYATSVGGTKLSQSSGTYTSETSWTATASTGTYGQSGYVAAEGGGGGISQKWSLPSWQSGLSTVANKGSSSMRMVPDVSLEADPSVGYVIYYSDPTDGANFYGGIGGTSCAAPLWAAFTALVNQNRITNGWSRIGFLNPTLYPIAGGSSYSTAFHDIADASSNLYYPAETGYDLTTGWGSFNGAGLLSALTPSAAHLTVTLTTPSPLTIGVSWTSFSGSGFTYSVLRGTSASGPFTTIASGLSTTSYTDSGLTYGTYYYSVEVVQSPNTSLPSTVESATTTIAPPSAPSNLVFTVNP